MYEYKDTPLIPELAQLVQAYAQPVLFRGLTMDYDSDVHRRTVQYVRDVIDNLKAYHVLLSNGADEKSWRDYASGLIYVVPFFEAVQKQRHPFRDVMYEPEIGMTCVEFTDLLTQMYDFTLFIQETHPRWLWSRAAIGRIEKLIDHDSTWCEK